MILRQSSYMHHTSWQHFKAGIDAEHQMKVFS